jgi:hypothetical protein
MTAASRHPSPTAFLGRRLERILLVLVVCVPVPTLALSGLAIPLPGVVERIGAALVPWADAATLDSHTLASSTTGGSIVLTPGQRATPEVRVESAEPTARRTIRATRPRASRALASGARNTPAQTLVQTREPETPRAAPTEPASPHSDGATPAAPAEPTAAPTHAPAADPGASVPAPAPPTPTPAPAPAPTPAPAPSVEPVPNHEPTKEPDVKPTPAEPEVRPAPVAETAPPPAEPDPAPAPPLELPKLDLQPVVDLVETLLNPLLPGKRGGK